MHTSQYPHGSNSFYSRYVAPVLKFYKRSDHTEFYSIDGDNKRVLIPDTVRQVRRRCTIAEVNAGVTLLAALPGYKYRMVRAKAIAIGGNVGTLTTVDILGTLSSSRKLVAFAQASLTRSTVLKDGASGAAVLADGASYTANDANTAITVGKTGGVGDTATHVDILFEYVVEVA